MRVFRNLLATAYLLAGAAVVGAAVCLLTGTWADRVEALLSTFAGRIAAFVALGILGLGVLINAIATYVQRAEPACVHPGGDPAIEVSLAAITSAARRSAGADDVLIESVTGRIAGRDRERVRLTVEAIAFQDEGLDRLAERMRVRVSDACERLLGTTDTEVRVRFLPSKTTIVTKEVPDEQ